MSCNLSHPLIESVPMNSKVPKRYYFIPFIYLLLIAFFIYLHIFSLDTISERVGSIALEVKSRGKGVHSLSIFASPLTLRFSRTAPLVIELEDGTRKNAVIQGYTLFPNEIELQFTGDLLLRISSGNQQKKETTFQFYTRDMAYNSATFYIPYFLEDETDWTTAGRIPVLSLSNGEEYGILSSSQGSIFDPENSLILMTPVDGKLPALILQSVGEDNRDPLTFWFSRDALKVEQEEYDTIIAQYLDNSYNGWKDSRFNRSLGEWELPDGSYQFDEKLLNAFLSESILRNEYEKMFLQINSSVRSHQKELTSLTAPFFGNLAESAEQLRDSNIEKAKTLTALTAKSDLSVFSVPDLLLFAINHGPYSLIEEIYQFARIVECDDTDSSTCLGLVKTFLDGDPLLLPAEENHIDYETIIEEGILPWITKSEEGLFLEISRGIIDTVTSLKAGILLIQAGDKINNDVFVSIGRYLVISVISLSEDRGFLPGKLIIEKGTIAEQHERVSPETVYHLLKGNPYYPHEVSLHREIAPGAWLYTSGDIHSIQINSTKAEIDLSFPQGMSHYMIIQGISPFLRMQFYGINWVSDPSFETYSSGWAYNERTQTLLIKLRHRQEREQIQIFFTE